MQSVTINSLADHEGQEVRVSAWVYNMRSSGKIVFLELRDGLGWTQAVVSQAEVAPDIWKTARGLSQESSGVFRGRVSRHPKSGVCELHITGINLLQRADKYPISKKEHGVDFLMDHRHLWLRSKRQWAVQRVRTALIQGLYDFFLQRGFIKVDAPILTPNACEGTSELFAMPYFDQTAYLSQSGQLYLEAAIFSHNRVFDFGPVFRAEKSKTRRHLTEFWMLDAEMAFTDHRASMDLQEELVEFMVTRALERCVTELAMLERDIAPLQKIKRPFARMTHGEAVETLQSMGSDIMPDQDLGGDDETMLTKRYDTPVIVEKFPAAVKAFYMKRDPNDTSLALCNDILAPEGYGEIIGGSEREDDYKTLRDRIAAHKLPVHDFEWYLDLRKYGSVPHAGFGLGLERLVAWICGLTHVREAIPFARTITRLRP